MATPPTERAPLVGSSVTTKVSERPLATSPYSTTATAASWPVATGGGARGTDDATRSGTRPANEPPPEAPTVSAAPPSREAWLNCRYATNEPPTAYVVATLG